MDKKFCDAQVNVVKNGQQLLAALCLPQAAERTTQSRRVTLLELLDSDAHNTVADTTDCARLAQTLALENKQWDEKQLSFLQAWLKEALQQDEVSVSVFACIEALVKTHPSQATSYWELFHSSQANVSQCLRDHAAKGSVGEDFVIVGLHCCDTLATGIGGNGGSVSLNQVQTEVAIELCELVMHLYYGSPPAFRDASASSCTLFALNSLSLIAKIAALFPDLARAHVGELLGLAKAFLSYGVDGSSTTLPVLHRVHPAQQTLYSAKEEEATHTRPNGGKVSKSRKPRVGRNKPIDDVQRAAAGVLLGLSFDFKTSDSEVSEPESASSRTTHDRHRCSKVRLLAINLLGVTTTALEQRILYGFWHAIFSGGGIDHRDPPPLLLNISLRDPSMRCRSAALQVAIQLIHGAKGFLQQAEYGKAPAFLTFSQNLALIIVAMYHVLVSILAGESSVAVLAQALKCLAVLVQATPFHKLKNGIIPLFAPHVKSFAHHRDGAIQVSALMVMEFLVATPQLTVEIAEAIGFTPQEVLKCRTVNGDGINDDVIQLLTEEEYYESDEELPSQLVVSAESSLTAIYKAPSWLLARVLDNLDSNCPSRGTRVIPSSVRIESLQLLATIASHITLLITQLPQVADRLCTALHDASVDVRLYAARCLDSYAYEIGRFLITGSAAQPADIALCEQFWQQILPTIMDFVGESQDQGTPALKITLCDALSNMGVVVFERLPRAVQLQLISFLSGISSSTDPINDDANLRAAALRAMAVFVLFPSLCQDLVFVENMAESIVLLMDDRQLLVRVKAMWALGNVSDALVAHSGDERISDELLQRLLGVATQACSDHDKVRCNAVRSLGNLLRLFDDIGDSGRRALAKLCDCVRTSAGNAKVKWNACYAIGNLLRNNTLFEGSALKNWQEPLYSALCHVIVHHSNFKVRINAATAIRNIERREHFAMHFEMFWTSLLVAIEQSVRLENFSEYNHRDQLQEQLCLTLCHLIACALVEDFTLLKRHLAERMEVVRSTWVRAANRLVPEKAAPLLSCSVMLQERFKADGAEGSMGLEQRNAITFIVQAFSCM